MTTTLNLTEILSSLQDYMTADGAISSEQRSFYTAFRGQLDLHPGAFLAQDIQRLLQSARIDMAGDVDQEEFECYVEAVMSKVSLKERLEVTEKVVTRSQEEIDAMVHQAEAEARAAVQEEYRLRAKFDSSEPAPAEQVGQSDEEVATLIKEKARIAAEEARVAAQDAASRAEVDGREQLRKDEHDKAMAEIESARIAAEEETARIKAETESQLAEAQETLKRAESEAAYRKEEDEARRKAESELEDSKRKAEAELTAARESAALAQETLARQQAEAAALALEAEAERSRASEDAALAQERLALQQAEAERVRAGE